VGSVENGVLPRKNAVLAVEWIVENRLGLSDLIHTLHALHTLHIASTIDVHKMWITYGTIFPG